MYLYAITICLLLNGLYHVSAIEEEEEEVPPTTTAQTPGAFVIPEDDLPEGFITKRPYPTFPPDHGTCVPERPKATTQDKDLVVLVYRTENSNAVGYLLSRVWVLSLASVLDPTREADVLEQNVKVVAYISTTLEVRIKSSKPLSVPAVRLVRYPDYVIGHVSSHNLLLVKVRAPGFKVCPSRIVWGDRWFRNWSVKGRLVGFVNEYELESSAVFHNVSVEVTNHLDCLLTDFRGEKVICVERTAPFCSVSRGGLVFVRNTLVGVLPVNRWPDCLQRQSMVVNYVGYYAYWIADYVPLTNRTHLKQLREVMVSGVLHVHWVAPLLVCICCVLSWAVSS